jgi:hypothetical protein
MLGPPTDKRKPPSPFPAAMTFMVSAIWHGFYSGYMIFFGMAAYFSWKSKFAEKTIYPKALSLGVPDFAIYLVNWFYLWVNTAYWVVAFYLLNWDRYDKVYASMNYAVHYAVAGVTVLLLLSSVLCPAKRDKPKTDKTD